MRNIVAELRALADREGLGLPDEAADEIEYLRPVAARYEELRSIIDGGSESMTHKDAIAEVKWLQSRVAELEAARGEPVAWMRRWHHDGETPAKRLNANGRMAWPFKFKLLPVTLTKALPDDVPLYLASPDAEDK